MTIGEWILLGGYIVVTLGLGWWIKLLRGAIDAQGKTIETQGKTIEAQGDILNEFKSLTSTMRELVESTNAPKMLERVKAYEEFVDKEKEVAIKSEREKAVGGMEEIKVRLLDEAITRLGTFSKLIMYVPPDNRKEIIDSLPSPKYPPEEETRDLYQKIAAKAPYLTPPRKESGLIGSLLTSYAALDVKPVYATSSEGPPGPPEQTEPGQKLRERLTGKKDKE